MTAKKLTIDEFNKDVIQEGKIAIIEFWAPWCTYCRRIEPAYDLIAEDYKEELLVGKVNIDEAPELEEKYGIEVVPTLIMYQNGEPIGKIVAPDSKAKIESFIQEYIKVESREGEAIHDVIVIGGGPGGYTAALYCARAGLDTVVLEKLSAGGQMGQTTQIDNYPGFEEGIDGFTLGEKMQKGAEKFGAKTELVEVTAVNLAADVKTVETNEGIFHGRCVILATGAEHRHLGIAGEEELIGHGVAYCAACDGMFYKGKTVAVVGGGNSAAADAMILSRICKKVIIIHRRDTLRATKVYHEPLMRAENVEFIWNSTVSELVHGDEVTGLKLKNVVTGEESVLSCDGVFISVGRAPSTELFRKEVELDGAGYVKADESTRTNLPGVFAVGDVRTKVMRQIVTAVADGAVASHYAEEYLAESR